MFELLVPGGVLIIDDYGSHDGARKAVDEFFEAQSFSPLLTRTAPDERLLIKH
jgi:hypothetical protein